MKNMILGILFLSLMLCACSTDFANKDIFDKAKDELYSSIEKMKTTPDTILTYRYSNPFGSGIVGFQKTTRNKRGAVTVYYSKSLRDREADLEYRGSEKIALVDTDKMFIDAISEIKSLRDPKRIQCSDEDFFKTAVYYKGEYYFYIGGIC